MRISPADIETLTTHIVAIQAAQVANEAQAATNQRLSKAVAETKPGSPERAAAEEAWNTARRERKPGPTLLELRDKFVDFAVRLQLLPDEEPKS